MFNILCHSDHFLCFSLIIPSCVQFCFHKTAVHWVETLTDGGKLRQMYRFSRIEGGGTIKKKPCPM